MSTHYLDLGKSTIESFKLGSVFVPSNPMDSSSRSQKVKTKQMKAHNERQRKK